MRAHLMLRLTESVYGVDVWWEPNRLLVLVLRINIKVAVHLVLTELLWLCHSIRGTYLATSVLFG